MRGRYFFFGDWCHQYLWTADLGAGSLSAVQATMQPVELPAGMEVGAQVTSIDQDAACRIYITSGANWVRRVDPPDTATGPDGCAKPPPPAPRRRSAGRAWRRARATGLRECHGPNPAGHHRRRDGARPLRGG